MTILQCFVFAFDQVLNLGTLSHLLLVANRSIIRSMRRMDSRHVLPPNAPDALGLEPLGVQNDLLFISAPGRGVEVLSSNSIQAPPAYDVKHSDVQEMSPGPRQVARAMAGNNWVCSNPGLGNCMHSTL